MAAQKRFVVCSMPRQHFGAGRLKQGIIEMRALQSLLVQYGRDEKRALWRRNQGSD